MDKQMAPVAATSSRANVALSPVLASSAESFKPRKFTEASFAGALVAGKQSLK